MRSRIKRLILPKVDVVRTGVGLLGAIPRPSTPVLPVEEIFLFMDYFSMVISTGGATPDYSGVLPLSLEPAPAGSPSQPRFCAGCRLCCWRCGGEKFFHGRRDLVDGHGVDGRALR